MFDDDDLNIFQEELGQEVTFILADATELVCKGVFDNEFLATELYGVTLETSGPVLVCRSVDIVGVAAGDTVVIVEYDNTTAKTYNVIRLQPNGAGETLIMLGFTA